MSPLIDQVAGAEGGADAIKNRRRGSKSFKTMSTGSLVSNSPFHQKTSAAPPVPPMPKGAGRGLYAGSRIPTKGAVKQATVQRTASGGSLHSVDENEPPVTGTRAGPSASVLFRPTRPTGGALPSGSTAPLSPNAFRPTRPVATSSSPWASSHPAELLGLMISPPLVPAPYEISSLSSESAPFSQSHPAQQAPAPSPTKAKGPVGLGIQPGGGPPPVERRITGSTVPPHKNSHARSASSGTVVSPSSALANIRRGMTGPRAPTLGERADNDEGEASQIDNSMDAAEHRRVLRRKASTKTVTWAEMEDVVVFETESRRASDASSYSDQSYGSAGSDDSDEFGQREDDASYDYQPNTSLGFAEGGSIEVHDLSSEDDRVKEDSMDDEASAVDVMLEDLTTNIDHYLRDADVFSPSQIATFSPSQLSTGSPMPIYDDQFGPRGYACERSAFSASTNGGDDDDVASVSDYGPMELDVAPRPPLPTIPTTRPLSPSNSRSGSPAKSHAYAPISQVSAGLTPAFELPDIPGTSPFLGFEDNGAPSSVVTLDLGSTEPDRPSTPTADRSISTPTDLTPTSARRPTQSTPTGRYASSLLTSAILDEGETGDSPILGSFGSAPPSAQALRALQPSPQPSPFDPSATAGSDAGSGVSGAPLSWYGSVSSVRSNTTGRQRAGREALEEQMRAHQIMLERAASSSGTGSLTSPSLLGDNQSIISSPFTSPDPSMSSPKRWTAALPPSPGLAIAARPANRPASATLSTSMVQAGSAAAGRQLEVGMPLTAELASEMNSPLDRLQRGIDQSEGGEWKHDHLKYATTRQRSKAERGPRRRSSSMSQLDERADEGGHEYVSQPLMQLQAMPSLASVGGGFLSILNSDFDEIYKHRDHKYRVRESKIIIRADDMATVGKAGDVDMGFLRKKRQSDAHALVRSMSVVSAGGSSSQSGSTKRSGQVFVKLVEANLNNLPLPAKTTEVVCQLDNGAANVEAGRFTLGRKIAMNKEFELTCPEDGTLSFSIDLRLPPAVLAAAAAAAAPRVAKPAPPPPSPTKAPGGFRSIFSSPKKRVVPRALPAPAPAPAPEPFLAYAGKDGKLAIAVIDFKAEADKCRHKLAKFTVPWQHIGFNGNGAQKTVAGTLVLEMLYLPAIPHVGKKDLPRSMDEVRQGMALAEWHAKVLHEGVLTQLGGDCHAWRRRMFKLRGNCLLPYSEVTKKASVEIDLSLAVAVVDPNAPSEPNYDDDDELTKMDPEFKLTFKNAGELRFFADSEADKANWIEVLSKVVGVKGKKAPPGWAVALRKQQLKQAAAAAAASPVTVAVVPA